MDLTFTADEQAFRAECRSWLQANVPQGESLAAPLAVESVERSLPENIFFVATETSSVAPSQPWAATPPAYGSLDAAWAEPVYFYPDGTTTDARLVLENEFNDQLELSLRGLTGVATVGGAVRFPGAAAMSGSPQPFQRCSASLCALLRCAISQTRTPSLSAPIFR